jgi:hypothetical protein
MLQRVETMRESLAMRADFNIPDLFKLFIKDLGFKKKGIELSDLFFTLRYTLGFSAIN